MMALLAVLLALPFASNNVRCARVDLVEVNHYHDSHCRHVFDQLIFYDWSVKRKRYDVRDWRLIKSDSMLPATSRGKYVARWHEDSNLCEVIATSKRETWTQFDPELLERNGLHQEDRKPLFE